MELGPALAAVALRRLRGLPSAEVVVAEFESREPPAEPFDAVVCATACHWLDPAVRVPATARALRAGGRFALVTTEHAAGGTQDFSDRVQRCYELWDPATPPGLRLRLRRPKCPRTRANWPDHRALAAPARRGLLTAAVPPLAR